MSMLDDTAKLRSWIRKTFITCDDTGVSEDVLAGENDIFTDDSSSGSTSPTSHHSPPSPDITIKKEKKLKGIGELDRKREDIKSTFNTSPLYHQVDFNEGFSVQGEMMKMVGKSIESSDIVRKGKDQMEKDGEPVEFAVKSATVRSSREGGETGVRGGKKGGLMGMLEEHDRLVKSSPWGGYSRLEAPSYSGVKTFIIHPTMTTTLITSITTPTFVVSLASMDEVRVEDFVGLVCWRYYLQDLKPTLTKTHPSDYDLYMVDSEGVVDWDLPPLDHQQPIGKFAFKHLALFEKTSEVDAGENGDSQKYLKELQGVQDFNRLPGLERFDEFAGNEKCVGF